jgi:Xaa-Pro aminopeptidase
MTADADQQRVASLLEAQAKAAELFGCVASRGLVRAGATEKSLSAEIYALADELFGTTTHWHKRIVRAGKNTLAQYAVNPPNLTIKDDDIVFLDFGPVFERWEADFGRTYVLGADPLKHKLRDDVAAAFADGKAYFHEQPDITARELFGYANTLADRYGWEFGGAIAGHLIGSFPHERIPGDKVSLYVHPDNDMTMRSVDKQGRRRHWILEIHFVDRAREIGGFFEELLTV